MPHTHTPGPWTVDEINSVNGLQYQISHLYEDGCRGLTEDGQPHISTDQIADVHMDYFGDVALRNAWLLAAAPSLLAALKPCVKQLKLWMKDHGDDLASQEAIQGALNAIKLATRGGDNHGH